jgi:hypothetical protein
MKARTWSKAVKSHKILNFFLQNSIPIWWFIAKSIFFLASFSLGFAGEEDDGRQREKFYRGENEGETVIERRDVDFYLGTDLDPSII